MLALTISVAGLAVPDKRSVTGFITADSEHNGIVPFYLTRCSYRVPCDPPAPNWPTDAMVTAGTVWHDPQTMQWLWEHRGKRIRVTWEVLN